MANNAVATNNAIARIKPQDGSVLPIGELMERIIAAGDISHLQPGDRAHYLVRVAESAGLNPLSQPFDLIPGQGGKLVLYANKKASDQLRKLYGLTSHIISRETVEGVYVVEVEVSDGVRTETNIGAVPIKGLQGEALANALMKAFTKAKRRATLDYCGLGVLDESEVEGLRAAMQEQQRTEPTPLNIVVNEPTPEPEPAKSVSPNRDLPPRRFPDDDDERGWRSFVWAWKEHLKVSTPDFNTIRRNAQLPLLEKMTVDQSLALYQAMIAAYDETSRPNAQDESFAPFTDDDIIDATYQPKGLDGMPEQDRWTDG